MYRSPRRNVLRSSAAFTGTVQETCGRDVVIGSSASNIMTSTLQEGALYPDRIVVGHPFNPSHLLPTVEVVVGKQTSQETVDFTKQIYSEMDKVPVVCLKDEVGYLVQRINSQILETAIYLANNGYASVEDIDKAIMYGPGMRLPLCGQLLSIGLGVAGRRLACTGPEILRYRCSQGVSGCGQRRG